jgi:hypothetical protein
MTGSFDLGTVGIAAEHPEEKSLESLLVRKTESYIPPARERGCHHRP